MIIPVSSKGGAIAKRFHTLTTCMWSFARMNTGMNSECGTLNKLLSTFIALIRSTKLGTSSQKEIYLNPECIRSVEK